jgi:hypothetical protein
MTLPVANEAYVIANGTASTGPFITYFSTRNPTSNDINFKPSQRWFNTSNNEEWILVNFMTSNNITTANWQPMFSAVVAVETLTGNTGGPVGPTLNNINVLGSGPITVSGNPGTSTLTISYTGSSEYLTITFVTTSPYVVLTTDQFLAVDVSSIPITIELPNTAPTGKVYYIKDSTGNASTHNISVTTVGGTVTIDGQTTYLMKSNYQEISVVFDGTHWEVF